MSSNSSTSLPPNQHFFHDDFNHHLTSPSLGASGGVLSSPPGPAIIKPADIQHFQKLSQNIPMSIEKRAANSSVVGLGHRGSGGASRLINKNQTLGGPAAGGDRGGGGGSTPSNTNTLNTTPNSLPMKQSAAAAATSGGTSRRRTNSNTSLSQQELQHNSFAATATSPPHNTTVAANATGSTPGLAVSAGGLISMQTAVLAEAYCFNHVLKRPGMF